MGQTLKVPASTFQPLRSKAARATSVHRAGMNPWVGASVGSRSVIDPEYWLLISRVCLFRLCWKHLLQARPWLEQALRIKGRYRPVTKLFLAQLHAMHYEYQGALVFSDGQRTFHLVDTPIRHVERMLADDWMAHVTGHFAHRKLAGQLDVLDLDLCRAWTKFPVKDLRSAACSNYRWNLYNGHAVQGQNLLGSKSLSFVRGRGFTFAPRSGLCGHSRRACRLAGSDQEFSFSGASLGLWALRSTARSP